MWVALDGHVVVEEVIPRSLALELKSRVESILERERAHPGVHQLVNA